MGNYRRCNVIESYGSLDTLLIIVVTGCRKMAADNLPRARFPLPATSLHIIHQKKTANRLQLFAHVMQSRNNPAYGGANSVFLDKPFPYTYIHR